MPTQVHVPASGWRRAALLATFVALAATTVQLAGPRPALASDGYTETTTTTYTVNPAAGRLDVAIDIVFKNTAKNTSTTEYYFTWVYAWLERAATRVAATTDHGGAAMVLDKRGTGYDRWRVNQGVAILAGKTRRIHVTYQLPSGAPRSTSEVRVNPAFASFCVVASGDDGGTTRVVAPLGYEMRMEGEGGTLTPTTTATSTVWTTGFLKDPYAFWSCLYGTNPKGYAESLVTSPSGQKIDIESWPNDSTWQAQVKGEVNGTLARLEALVGRGLSSDGTITVREVATDELSGYAAFFDPTTGLAIVGEDYGSGGTVVHELSHAWFNDSLFDARWMSEGMAEWARISTVTDACPDPGSPPGGSAPDLAHWVFAGPRSTKAQIEAVDWEYRAACFLVDSVAAKAGQDGMRAALATMFDRQLAYRSGTTVLAGRPGAQTWRQWLDAVDELGLVPAGVTDLDFAQNLLARFGVASGPELANRSKARAAYHALLASIGDWTVPEAILRPMGEWQFGEATVAIDDVSEAVVSLAAADATLDDIDAADGPVKDAVENAKTEAELKAAVSMAADELAAAQAVADVEVRLDAPRDLLMTIGLLGSDPAAPLPAAKAAAAGAHLDAATTQVGLITSALSGASQQGLTRVAVVVTAVVVLILLLLVARRRRAAGRLAPAAAPADPATGVALTADVAPAPADEPGPAAEPSDAGGAARPSTPGT